MAAGRQSGSRLRRPHAGSGPAMKTGILGFAILAALLALSACHPPAPITDETMTRQQAEAIMDELHDMRALLERIDKQTQASARLARQPKTATLDIKTPGPTLGDDDAPVTVVEFTDYQCPYCKRFSQNTFPFMKRDYIDTGKVRWLVRDLPLGFHNNARMAAQAAYCAAEQDKFWTMRESLFRNSSNLDEEHLKTYAADLGLDAQAFNDCIASERYLAEIDAYAGIAAGLHLTGTPSFVVGRTQPDKLTGRVIIGAQSPAVFASEIGKLLPQSQAVR